MGPDLRGSDQDRVLSALVQVLGATASAPLTRPADFRSSALQSPVQVPGVADDAPTEPMPLPQPAPTGGH
jgi:hypothetical protein